MQLIVKNEKIKCDSLAELETAQAVVSADINLSEGDNVQKILAVCPTPRIVKTECSDGRAKIFGSILWRVIYCLTDNTICSGEYVTEYSDEINSEHIFANSKLMARSRVIDTDSTLAGGKLAIEGVVEICAVVTTSKEIDCVIGADCCFTKFKECEVSVRNSYAIDRINVSEDCDISAKVEKILSFTSYPVIKDAVCLNDCVKVEGEIFCDIVYMADSGAENKCYCIPFCEDIKAVGASQSDKAFYDCCIDSSKLLIAYENNKTVLRADIGLMITVATFGKKYLNLVCDMYSPNYNIEIARGGMECDSLVCSKFFEEKISGMAQLEENMPSVQNIIASVIYSNTISNIVAEEDVAIIEGMLSATVIYSDYDNKMNSVSVELPYSLKKSIVGVKKGDMILGSVVHSCANGRIKRDNEVEINTELKISLHVFSGCEMSCITESIQGEENGKCKKAISIYFAKTGDTFWDIGKALCASVETIKELNPLLSEPLKNNERVSIFRKLNLDESIM